MLKKMTMMAAIASAMIAAPASAQDCDEAAKDKHHAVAADKKLTMLDYQPGSEADRRTAKIMKLKMAMAEAVEGAKKPHRHEDVKCHDCKDVKLEESSEKCTECDDCEDCGDCEDSGSCEAEAKA
jgi:hypothetical protein